MPKRITRVTTRKGDKGTTALGEGTRLDKDHIRIEVIGSIDELNSHLGLVVAHLQHNDELSGILKRIQSELFDLGGEICIPGKVLIKPKHIERLDQEIQQLNAELPTLAEFILPGGTIACAEAHIARAVCRRAERQCVSLAKIETVHPTCLIYLNRLSDLLFVIARVIAKLASAEEQFWKREDKYV